MRLLATQGAGSVAVVQGTFRQVNKLQLVTLKLPCEQTGKRLEEGKIWTLLFQISCALHECHCRKQKILHRDIKVHHTT